MDSSILIPSDHKPYLRELYLNKIKEVQVKMQPFVDEVNLYTGLLRSLDEIAETPTVVQLSDYDYNASFIEKALFITDIYGELTMNEIAEKIREYEPQFTIEKITNNLSAGFSQDAKPTNPKPKLQRRKNEDKKYVYKRSVN